MKIIPGSRHHYLAIVSIFLVTAALIVGMAGCYDDVTRYDLTISRTVGGSVTTPGEGTFTYLANRTVNLVAEPHEHYHFGNWTGDVSTITDVEAASTTITMNDSYSIIAAFELDEGWYSLTISRTVGGSVTTPSVGISVYAANTTVNLVAEPDEHCYFVNWTGDVDTIGNVTAAATNITMYDSYYIMANFLGPQVTGGGWHTVGLKGDGTVVAVGDNYNGQCNVGSWMNITQISANEQQTAGLKTDGTVVYLGDMDCGQWDVGDWTDIIQVASGDLHTIGLKADGTVVAAGPVGTERHASGQCDVGNWTDIIQISAGCLHTVGLKSDGTVVAVGGNFKGQCDVGGWTDIIQVFAGVEHTVGLRADGTVVAVGRNFEGQCDVGVWTDIIIQVSAGVEHTVGLKTDGTVVAVGSNEEGQCDIGDWKDIVQIAAGWYHTIGLKADGTVIAVGDNDHGQCDVGAWMLN
jgi:hypothetical protein